jgi:hypothetical protein
LKKFVSTGIALALAALIITGAGCGGNDELERRKAPEYAPIVPGYSLARLDLDAPYSSVREVYGDPDEYAYKDGYIYAYYQRINEDAARDDPEAWHLVVVLNDNGNRDLDDQDLVGQIEVSAPYYGTTSGGNGLESTPQELLDEFGQFDGSSVAEFHGKPYRSYTFSRRGFEFMAAEEDQRVVTLVVTPMGGLKPAQSSGKQYVESSGDVFKATKNEPVVPGSSLAAINVGDNFIWVKDLYGLPNLTGNLGEGLVSATYTGGMGSWKLNVYLEDTDNDKKPSDFDLVISIAVRAPYEGKTPKGVSIGSKKADVTREFGPPEIEEGGSMGGEAALIWQYVSRGIVFAINVTTDEVIEIDVNKN